MSQQEYELLNSYLNAIFNFLMKQEAFCFNNFDKICDISDRYYMFFNTYKFNDNVISNHLTFNDVYLLGREIISSISSKYLSDYDKLIDSGILDFDFNNEYLDSAFVYCEYDGNTHCEVNIHRDFNYSDVVSLIHEFFHYTNGNSNVTKNRDILTEFISIYFETYAIDYLMKMGVSKEEICYEKRLFTTFVRTKYFYCMEMPLVCFYKFGSVDDDSYDMYKSYCFPLEKKHFDMECGFLLNEFEKIRKRNGSYNNFFLLDSGANIYLSHCKYLIGTIFAFYARGNCDLEDILYLNEHINDENKDIYALLRKIGIKLNSNLVLKALENMNDYLSSYEQVRGDL